MDNFEKVQLCYTYVLNAACDLSAMLNEENDVVEFGDILDALDKTTIILKRIGETQIIESVGKDVEDEA